MSENSAPLDLLPLLNNDVAARVVVTIAMREILEMARADDLTTTMVLYDLWKSATDPTYRVGRRNAPRVGSSGLVESISPEGEVTFHDSMRSILACAVSFNGLTVTVVSPLAPAAS